LRSGKLAERSIVALVLLIAPLVAGAQPAGRVYRIGMLETRSTVGVGGCLVEGGNGGRGGIDSVNLSPP